MYSVACKGTPCTLHDAPAELMWTIRGVCGSGRYALISPTVRLKGPALNAGLSSPVDSTSKHEQSALLLPMDL
jgi:hypothetical protein